MPRRRLYNPKAGTRRADAFGRMKTKTGPNVEDWEYTDVIVMAVQQGRSIRPCEQIIHVDGDITNDAPDNLELNSEEC
jgi:hypothetical protein